MIYIAHINVAQFTEQQVLNWQKLLPDNFKYRVKGGLITSKKSILARLLLFQVCNEIGILDIASLRFNLKHNGKLYIENFPSFNISHCKNKVVLAYSKTNSSIEIGVDIEQNRTMNNWWHLASYFEENEKNLIQNDNNPSETFLKIWTRKEAFYKALGSGIYTENSLKTFNSLTKEIDYQNQKWFFKSILVAQSHWISCVTNEEVSCQITEITYANLNTLEIEALVS